MTCAKAVKHQNRGISTVLGTLLLVLLVSMPIQTLLITLYGYHVAVTESISLSEDRSQERIVLWKLTTELIDGRECMSSLAVNNTGGINSMIRALYVNEQFLFDPSNTTRNPTGGLLVAKDFLNISLQSIDPGDRVYNPYLRIAVSTARGMRTLEHAWLLKGEPMPGGTIFQGTFGPLELLFEEFRYAVHQDNFTFGNWTEGWSPPKLTQLAWRVRVNNTDTRDISINQFSCFVLYPNEGGGRFPWYLNSTYVMIESATLEDLVYIWTTPLGSGQRFVQSTPSAPEGKSDCHRVFLCFFGLFHEVDGKTKPFAQTIPFEAIMIEG